MLSTLVAALDGVMPRRVDMEKVHNALRRGGAQFLLPV
jgi:hypothetical protein